MIGGSSAIHVRPLTEAVTFNVISSSSTDTSGGIGLRKMYIEGLDSSYNQIYEILTLNGTTGVNTTKQYIHVNTIAPYETGSSNVAQGANIDIRRTPLTDGQQYGRIRGTAAFSADIMEVDTGFYMVPRNTKAILTGFSFTAASSSNILLIVYRARPIYEVSGPLTRPYQVVARFNSTTNIQIYNYPIVVLNEKDCIYLFQTNDNAAHALMTFSLYDFDYCGILC